MNFWELEHPSGSPAIYTATTNRELTYGEVKAKVEELAAQMPVGEVFVLECCNNLNSLLAYLAALKARATPLLLNIDLAPIIADEFKTRFEIKSVFHGPTLTWKNRGNSKPLARDLGLLMATSGSSGYPKLVKLSRDNLQSNAQSIVNYLAINSNEVAITSLPITYSYGLSIVNSHLLAGAKIVLTDAAVTSTSFWDAFKGNLVSSLSGVPTTWRILNKLKFERMNLPSLKTLTQAGGRLDLEEIRNLAKFCASTGRRLFVMYGQTEATARISYVPSEHAATKAGSIGKAIPGGALSLVDPNGCPIEAVHTEGELVYRGPNVMLGYAETADDLAVDESITELHTGDFAYRDEDGYFWITGRKNRFIKLFGIRTGLDDVERQLRTMGIQSLATGEDDCLMVAVLEGTNPDEVREQLRKMYRVHPSAVQVFTVPEFPISPSGKVLYAELLCQLKNKLRTCK